MSSTFIFARHVLCLSPNSTKTVDCVSIRTWVGGSIPRGPKEGGAGPRSSIVRREFFYCEPDALIAICGYLNSKSMTCLCDF